MSKGYSHRATEPQSGKRKEIIEKSSFLFPLCGSVAAVAIASVPKFVGLIWLHGKLVTLGVNETLAPVAPPVLLITLVIPPLAPIQTVIMLWNLTLALLGASIARVRKMLGLVNTL